MSVWFSGSNNINCGLEDISNALDDLGTFFCGVLKYSPGLSTVELLKEEKDTILIKTNEGEMRRKNIVITKDKNKITMDYDEDYDTGKLIKVKSHSNTEFTVEGKGIKQTIVVSDVKASGFMGFLYRNFGKSNIGKALLASNKQFFEG